MNNSKLCSQNLCTGCFACKQVCAKGAIYITKINGFLYPKIDTFLCVDCGLCTKICPVLKMSSVSETRNNKSVCYAIWNRIEEDRMNSSSGGVFSALANKTIKEEGIVYGAAWNKNMQLKHIGIDDVKFLDSLRRSKYVQSNTDEIYKDVKIQVKSGRKTLFCGTPCQIAGLLSFLGKRYSNLITIGVVCHGVPSQISFDKYIREIEKEEKVKVYDCNFRSKDRGWRTGLNLLVYGKTMMNKDIIINKITSGNSYFNAFLKQYFLRESCYNCPFKRDNREDCADIMLSDFWSLWSAVPWGEVDFGKGISAVITNTENGRDYLNQCAESLIIKERPYLEYLSNSGLRVANKPKNNDNAFEFLQMHSWKETQSKYFPLSLSDRFPVYSRLLFGENLSILIKKTIKKIRKR